MTDPKPIDWITADADAAPVPDVQRARDRFEAAAARTARARADLQAAQDAELAAYMALCAASGANQ